MANKLDAETTVKRNPHPDFKKVEASRPPFESKPWKLVQTPKPDWKPGEGANDKSDASKKHREIDPNAEGRPVIYNYKLLISGIVPRPVGFVSTLSEDGKGTNLAPFSYFNMISHNPPLFILGFGGGYNNAKDTLLDIKANEECTINMISEDYIEAANYTAINTPMGISEWALSGLTPAKSKLVKPDRVQEAVFSIEAKLVEMREWESRVTPGKKTGVLGIVEGVNFWVREDAINEEENLIDPAVLKPICRLGGITYGRVTEGFELPRPVYNEAIKDPEVAKLAKPKADGQLE